ncbi:MAG TPA: sensor histidine kinase [Spirochaetota bacterium]|nr:sensor histidine kinase [Spirochaetota bacterium]HPS85499.1 sensor histidine kinase [Spirochaetota bacterium]
MITLLEGLVNQVGSIVLVAVLLSRFSFFKRLITRDKIPLRYFIMLGIFFGLFGILKTYSGIPVKGALANARVVGVFVGGLIGGPVVGILSGLIAGLHRWAIDIGGFTAFACMVSTVSEGILAGFLSKKFYNSDKRWLFALYTGALAEAMQMIIILILVKPFDAAFDLVSIIGVPMIVANAIGISMLVAIVDQIFSERDRIAANQSRIVLQIANKTINYFRKGLNEETTSEAAHIIKEMTGVSAVSFTSMDRILSHVGTGSDHHIPGIPLVTEITKMVLKDGKPRIADTKEDISCMNKNCTLSSAVIVPLKENEKVIGSLKIYKTGKSKITSVDVELAEGLASLFSTQIELSRIDEQAKLLNISELKALQAQINPHFLFNSINTIVSLIRTSPDKARDLLVKLGSYFRNNLYHSDEISLSDEIQNLRNYLEIEKARFGDKLHVVIDVPESISCMIPPFTLQPLVENALKHGLLPRVEGGSIEIRGEKDGRNVLLTVRDNGTGIDEEKLLTLLDDSVCSKSIGIRNVNKRLICKYGSSYGLKLESWPGSGTLVSLVIPGVI